MAKSIKTQEDCLSGQVLSLAEGSEAYKELRQCVIKSGLLDRSYGYIANDFSMYPRFEQS